MVLYTCGQAELDFPGPLKGHPCAKAMRALDAAGHTYELQKVKGYRALPWSSRGEARDHIEALSGQRLVPVLVLDDDTVIHGSDTIVKWAEANPAA